MINIIPSAFRLVIKKAVTVHVFHGLAMPSCSVSSRASLRYRFAADAFAYLPRIEATGQFGDSTRAGSGRTIMADSFMCHFLSAISNAPAPC